MANEKVEAKVSEARKAVVDVLVKLMEDEGLNWVSQWEGSAFIPHNGFSGRRYHGGNRLHLMAMAYINDYADSRWYTFKQAKELGFGPKKGEKASIVEYWKTFKLMRDENGVITSDPDTADKSKTVIYPKLCGYFSVFNAEQLVDSEGNPIEREEIRKPVLEPELCEMADTLILTSRCSIKEHESIVQACYKPLVDVVEIPSRTGFTSMGAFLATLTHEMAHSTMKPLGRVSGSAGRFGSETYAYEELVAELSSAFTCLDLGVHRMAGLENDENFENHAAYLQSWLRALQDNPDYIFKAASEADKATDYIMERFRADDLAKLAS